MTMKSYRDRVNAENLASQADSVRKIAAEILASIEDVQKYLYWAIEPGEQEAPGHWESRLIEQAHALVDMAHEYKAALAANPPPKTTEDNPEDDLQFNR